MSNECKKDNEKEAEQVLGWLLIIGISFASIGSIALWGLGITFLTLGIICFVMMGYGIYRQKQKAQRKESKDDKRSF